MRTIKQSMTGPAKIKIVLDHNDKYRVIYDDTTLFTRLNLEDAYTIYYKLGGK